MRIAIGTDRLGRDIEVEVTADAALRSRRFLLDYAGVDDRYDAFCLVLYLRRKELEGWRLTAVGSERLFEDLAAQLERDHATSTSIQHARSLGISPHAFADIEYGQKLALPGLG